jgi:hypothetical protein
MNKYNFGKIYSLKDNITGNVYIGSTCDELWVRLEQHINSFNYGKKCCLSREILINNDYKMELIEQVNVETKEELEAIENEYIKKLDCVNIRNNGDPEERKKISYKKYYEKNKERILQRQSERQREDYQENPEKYKAYKQKYEKTDKAKATRDKYYIENWEKKKEYSKEYSLNLKETSPEYHKEHHKKMKMCECGFEYKTCSMSRHKETEIHKKRMELLNK